MTTTEHITVLFTDLVGSTELQSSLAPDTADDVRQRGISSALRQAIATSGWHRAKNFGRRPRWWWSSSPPRQAPLVCAVAMQQAVHRENVGAERHLGIAGGAQLRAKPANEDGDYFGDPGHRGGSGCAPGPRAGPDPGLRDGRRSTRVRRNTHAFTSLGRTRAPRSLPDPVEALWRSAWVPLDDDVFEAASEGLRCPCTAGLHRPTVGIIGREAELATMAGTAEAGDVAAKDGRSCLSPVNRGQGKTTLVGEFARSAHEDADHRPPSVGA